MFVSVLELKYIFFFDTILELLHWYQSQDFWPWMITRSRSKVMASQNEEVEARMERMEQTNQETMAAIQILLQKFASTEARFHDKGPPGFASFGKLPEQVNQETVTHTAKNSHRPELPIFIGEGPDGWL